MDVTSAVFTYRALLPFQLWKGCCCCLCVVCTVGMLSAGVTAGACMPLLCIISGSVDEHQLHRSGPHLAKSITPCPIMPFVTSSRTVAATPPSSVKLNLCAVLQVGSHPLPTQGLLLLRC
eukprot:GHUV01016567.1.p3 GENE.GHUV01016567.1~~GHUV01016567.1.p3  ORF type:complete len:120 (-),score=6.61 GHUV01016567.1:883-1242(-)